jgi:hypothetical protein
MGSHGWLAHQLLFVPDVIYDLLNGSIRLGFFLEVGPTYSACLYVGAWHLCRQV